MSKICTGRSTRRVSGFMANYYCSPKSWQTAVSRLFTVPYFFVRLYRYTASYRHLIFKCTEGASVGDYRAGSGVGGEKNNFSRLLTNRPCPLSSFKTHARWQPVTQSARSWWSYGKIEDCEQSSRFQFSAETSTALQRKSQKRISRQVLVCLPFIGEIFFHLRPTTNRFPFSFQKCRISREFCRSFTGSYPQNH